MRSYDTPMRWALWLFSAALLLAPLHGAAETDEKMFEQTHLDRLLAPIADHPDDLVDKILMAATYPLEVTQAARTMQTNKNLSGLALQAALGEKDWHPSVKSLVAFPDILRMMNEKIEWTQELGDAYIVQKADVLSTVRWLRHKAETRADQNGQSGGDQVVTYYVLHGSPPPDTFVQEPYPYAVVPGGTMPRRVNPVGVVVTPRPRPIVVRPVVVRRVFRRRR